MSNTLHFLLEDQVMSRDHIGAVSKFYDDWNSSKIVRECQLLFSRLRRLDRPIAVAEISEKMRQNHALADMAPNFISVLKTYIVFPGSACQAERKFLHWAD